MGQPERLSQANEVPPALRVPVARAELGRVAFLVSRILSDWLAVELPSLPYHAIVAPYGTYRHFSFVCNVVMTGDAERSTIIRIIP